METLSLRKSLERVDFAIFDFDGTIYPRLFLYDLAYNVFSVKNLSRNVDKLKKLESISNLYKEDKFKEAYLSFLDLLKLEKKQEFVQVTDKLVDNIYEYAKKTIGKLHEKYNLDIYLVSITSSFIAEIVAKKLNLEGFEAVEFLTIKKEGEWLFDGKVQLEINDPEIMKKTLLTQLFSKVGNGKKFACFVNSEDDLPIIEKASLKIGINPTKELLSKSKLDLIMVDDMDPWIKFYELL